MVQHSVDSSLTKNSISCTNYYSTNKFFSHYTHYTYPPREPNHPTPPPSPGEATHMNSLPTWFECFQNNPTTNKSSLEPTVRLDKQILQTAEAAGVP